MPLVNRSAVRGIRLPERRALRAVTLSSLAALLLAGCAEIPDARPQVAQVQAPQLGLDTQAPAIDATWWTAYSDPQLNRLIELSLADNPTLDTALARLRAAVANVEVRHAAQLPQISADGDVQHERFSNDYLIPPPYAGTDKWVPTIQGSLSWDLDLFGRQMALVAQAKSSADAQRLDTAAARLAIATAVAQSYVGLAAAERQITVADGFVQTRRKAVRLAKSRSENELSDAFDLRQAETLLAEAEQARTRAVGQRDMMVHALAALAGRGADFYAQIGKPALALDQAPAVPGVIPADLLGRRPDLLAGQARIDAAVSGRTAARADFFPDVNLQALVGLASIGFGNFVGAGSAQYSVGAAVHVPIFEGGKLRAQYRGATADLDAAVADYNNAVIGAVRQSADALTEIRATDEDVAEQRRVLNGLRETVRLDQVRVTTGLSSQLDTIDSGFRLLEAEQSLINLQADAITHRVQLVAALGGGFSPSQPLTTAKSDQPPTTALSKDSRS